MLKFERRKGWIIYATLFDLPIELINKNNKFIDIFTSLENNIFSKDLKGIYLLFKESDFYLENIFIKNRFYFDKKSIKINNIIYVIYFFRIINKFDATSKFNISDELLEQYYDYSLNFAANTTLIFYINKIIENCCKVKYYNYNELLNLSGYKHILKNKGQFNTSLYYYSSSFII